MNALQTPTASGLLADLVVLCWMLILVKYFWTWWDGLVFQGGPLSVRKTWGGGVAGEYVVECVYVGVGAGTVDHLHLREPAELVHHHQDLLAVWCGALLVSALEFLGSCGGGVWL